MKQIIFLLAFFTSHKIQKRMRQVWHMVADIDNPYMPMTSVLVEVKVIPWFHEMALRRCPVVLDETLCDIEGYCSLPTYRPGWGVLIRFHILRQESRWRPKVGETKEWRLEIEADKFAWDGGWVMNWARWIGNGELWTVNCARGWLQGLQTTPMRRLATYSLWSPIALLHPT